MERADLVRFPRRLRQSLLAVLAVVLPGCGMSADYSMQTIPETLERATAANPGGRGGGLILVAGPGESVEAYAAGRRGGADGGPLTPETPFGLASITKTLVAALTLIYAERGLVDLDAPALAMVEDADWLLRRVRNDGFRRTLEATSLRDLLAHRSGLPDYWESHAFYDVWHSHESKQWDHLELLDWAGRMSPVCATGRCYRYSDTNYVVLGLLLEKRFGKALHDLLREEILAPLGMACTWMYFEEAAPAGCGPVAHSYEGRLDVTGNRLQSADWSGGGLYSTLADQHRFLAALFLNGELLKPASLAAMMRWQPTDEGRKVSYGLGLYKIEVDDGMTLVGHVGVHNAFSYLWQETGIILTGSLNQENNDARRRLVTPVLRILEQRRRP